MNTTTSLSQQLLDATMPGRNDRHRAFAENAPDHVLQHIIERMKSHPHTHERTFLNHVVNTHPFRFNRHEAEPDLKKRELALLDAVVFASDLIPYCYRISIYAAGHANFLQRLTDELMRYDITVNRENLRSIAMTRILHCTVPVEDWSITDTFEYVRKNLSEFDDCFVPIISYDIAISDAEELISVYRYLRSSGNFQLFHDHFENIVSQPLKVSDVKELVRTHSSLRGGFL